MSDSIETYFLSREELTLLENALKNENEDEKKKELLIKYIDNYNDSIERCLENPNKQSVNFLRYYLRNKRFPLINKMEIKI